MFSIEAVTKAAELKLHYQKDVQSELALFEKLDMIATAQFAANQAVKYMYKRGLDRGFRIYAYSERPWVLTDQKAMALALKTLKARYGEVKFEIDSEENSVTVKWAGTPPMPCTKEEVQERHNGKLFAYVATNQRQKIIKQIQKGADVNAKGPFGRTPLYAVMKDSSLLELLIEKGAKVNVVDDFGMSPLDVARLYSDSSPFIEVLRKHGAKTGKEIAPASENKEWNE